MPVVAPAALAYCALVFAFGVALGVLRVALLVPAAGELGAVALEVPAILAIAWLASRAVVRRLRVSRSDAARLAMGGLALAMLMAAEASLGAALGRDLAARLAAWREPAGALGLAAPLGFAVIPWLQARLARRG